MSICHWCTYTNVYFIISYSYTKLFSSNLGSIAFHYNALIHCYLRSQNVSLDKLVYLYLGVKRFGPVPNALNFNTLLNRLLALNNPKIAFLIAKEMHRSGLVPSSILCQECWRKWYSWATLLIPSMFYSSHAANSWDCSMRRIRCCGCLLFWTRSVLL